MGGHGSRLFAHSGDYLGRVEEGVAVPVWAG